MSSYSRVFKASRWAGKELSRRRQRYYIERQRSSSESSYDSSSSSFTSSDNTSSGSSTSSSSSSSGDDDYTTSTSDTDFLSDSYSSDFSAPSPPPPPPTPSAPPKKRVMPRAKATKVVHESMLEMINKTSLDKRRIKLHVIPSGLTKQEWALVCELWRNGKLQKKEILFAANLDDKTFSKFSKADRKKLLFMLHPDKNTEELKPLCNVLFSKVRKMCIKDQQQPDDSRRDGENEATKMNI